MKSEKEKSGRFLVIAIFFLLFISTAQGAWTNNDLIYAKSTAEIQMPVHNINTTEDFENIQAAIDDPDTKGGHTIFVDAGIYRERVVINKQLKLIGVNKDTTSIDGGGSGNCIQITADNVEISGFTIKNDNYGIYLESSNCRVINNDITSVNFDGISLRSNSVNNTIAHNRLSKVKRRSIDLSSSSNNRIHDNDLSENGDGITLFSSHNNTFYHNRLTDNSNCGISLTFSKSNIIRDNDLSGSDKGVDLSSSDKNYVYHNNFIDNRIQAKDSRDTNRWDNGPIDGGNYWSDHKCTGNPSDGSQPYDISSRGATDKYPFMNRDGWLCTLPSSPTLADPGTNDTDGNYTVSWCSVSNASIYTLEEDTSGLFSSPTKIYSGSGTSKEITGKSDGTYYYRVMACNECGCSEWSNIVDINIDTMPPNVTIMYPTKRQMFWTDTITVNGTASDNVAVSKVEVKVESESWQTASGTTSWSTAVTLAVGSNTIHARATDRSGNINQTSVTVTYDTLANLTVTILYPNGGESIPVGTQVPVSVHATDDTAVTNVTFSYSSNGGSTWNIIGAGIRVSGTDKDGIWNETWNTSGLSVGSKYMIKAVASDGTFTRADLSDSNFSLCTLPSPPTLNDPGTNDTDGNYTVSWSTVSSATNYTLEEDTSSLFSSPTKIYSRSGTSKEITGKSEGTYYYRVKACNECGCSEWSNIEDINIEYITKDTILPTVTILYPTSGQTFRTTTITVNGTALDNVAVSKVEVRVGSESWQTASGTASWSTLVTLENGSNTIYARATDTSENINQTSVRVFVKGESEVTISVTSTISDGVTISGNISPAHSAIVTLTFTTLAGIVLEESTISTTNGNYKFDFTPYERGVWHVNATWAGDSDTAGNISKTVSFTVNRGQVYYAIIIAGEKCDPIEPYVALTANRVYKKLLTCGFTHKRIFYLNPSMEQDLDGDGIYDVDRISSLTDISYAINTWAQGNVSANDSLLLYMVGKDEENTFCVKDIDKTTLTATVLDNHLDNFTNATGCKDIVVVYDAHCSGSFIDELSGTGRIIVTSTNSTTNTEVSDRIKGGFFSYYFFKSISAGESIKEAFEAASNSPEIEHQNMTPLLDDNGDGIGHAAKSLLDPDDGSVAAFKYIGILYGASPPRITDLIPSQNVTKGTNITIWAVVVSDSLIEEVFARITKLGLPMNNTRINLTYREDLDGDAKNYTANFKPNESGNYSLILHATDEEGYMASSKQRIIRAVESAIFGTGEETYTYPWKGTGGHSEYEKIWNSTWKGVDAYFMGGEITHQEFVDTKGHLNSNGIPAIKLKDV